MFSRMRRARAIVARRLRSAWLRRSLLFGAVPITLFLLILFLGFIHHIYFDRSGLPDIEGFLRFEPPTTGRVYDARGKVLIELAREYRRVASYDEVPEILRQAVLAAEDKNFFSHSGVEYRALPRVLQKMVSRSLAEWRKGGGGFRLIFPQGGSTLTQQLVRGYFLQDRTSLEDGDALFREGPIPRLLSAGLGGRATNKLLRKLEEVRLALWLEEEMRRRYGSKEEAKRQIFSRFASFHYMGNGRYGFAAASEYYFGRPLSSYTPEDAGEAALLAGIIKSPGVYAPIAGGSKPLRRRNEILALMARNGCIPESLAKRCQAKPIRVAAHDSVKTYAPAAIKNVFDELKQHGVDRFTIEDLFGGRIEVFSTIEERIQTIVNEALENGLVRYEQRHPGAKGSIQGSVVVLGNADAAILAEAGGRQVFMGRDALYSDYNRVTQSLRQPGSAWKPMVYLAAFIHGLDLNTTVPDEPIGVSMGANRGMKWISNFDNEFKGPIPIRQALAESRNAAAVWITREIGLDKVIRTARQLGIRTQLQPFISTALGASEVRLLELADAYRAIASGVSAEPYVIDRVMDTSGMVLYAAAREARTIDLSELSMIQEGLRGVVRLPDGTAHSLVDGPEFPIPVMGKTGTTSNFRDALFVGSTYGTEGITVAVRIGFDDNRTLGGKETGGRAALPIFREIMLHIYRDNLIGPAPPFPCEIEEGIDEYLATQALPEAERAAPSLQVSTTASSPHQ